MKTIPCFLLLLVSLLYGCAVGPGYEPPDTALEDFPQSGEAAPDPVAWWSRFEDPALEQLLRTTMANNHSLEAGRQNILKARGLLDRAEAANRPQLSMEASVIRQERSENSLFPVLENTPGFPDRTETLYHAGFDATWEIDLFGANRSGIESAELRVEASQVALRDLQSSLLAETGRLYVSWLSLSRSIEHLRRNIDLQEQITDVVKTRYESGVVSELEAARAESLLNGMQASLPSLLAEQESILLALAALTAEERPDLRNLLDKSADLPEVDAFFGDRIGSEVLRQRPDIRLAENRVRQANEELGLHVANLYPRFVLVGSLGLESVDAGTFAESASRFWRLGPSITLPILEGGRLRGQVEAAEAELQIQVAQYKQQVLLALQESGTALARFNRAVEEKELIRKSWASAERALQAARRQYQAGTTTLDSMLAVEQQELAARDQLVRARSRCAIQLISLGKSLGGSWDFPQ